MPRKKGNKKTKQSVLVITTPVIFAKCAGCRVNAELQPCEFCQFPKCMACIGKHREADKLSQSQAMLQTKINHLRQQTGEKYLSLLFKHIHENNYTNIKQN